MHLFIFFNSFVGVHDLHIFRVPTRLWITSQLSQGVHISYLGSTISFIVASPLRKKGPVS